MKLNQTQVQHLLLRSGFGDSYPVVKSFIGKKPEEIFGDLITKSNSVRPVETKISFTPPYLMKESTPEEKQEMRKTARQSIKTLNALWIKEMVNASSALNEKMAFFWHDHFPIKSNNPLFVQSYLNIIRENALGNFGDLLVAVSKSAAMLQYLNNQQNRKSSPNENFAREVMELFTLGRDQGYTEKDISEAARAFTGWAFEKDGNFILRKKQHDEGLKTVLGNTGNYHGEQIINLLLGEKQTARYISQKWVRYFVHPDGQEDLENEVAEALFSSNYDIKCALHVLFTSKSFYDERNFGVRIKSPIELIVSMQRQLGVKIEDEDSLTYLQRTMGQTLFDPPNVAGWPDGKAWVDSASLLFRMRLPELVFKAAAIENEPEESFDDNDQFKLKGPLKKLDTQLNLESLQMALKDDQLAEFISQIPVQKADSKKSLIDQIVYYTSKPEFQLC